jgi:hypothetical protein
VLVGLNWVVNEGQTGENVDDAEQILVDEYTVQSDTLGGGED